MVVNLSDMTHGTGIVLLMKSGKCRLGLGYRHPTSLTVYNADQPTPSQRVWSGFHRLPTFLFSSVDQGQTSFTSLLLKFSDILMKSTISHIQTSLCLAHMYLSSELKIAV